MLIHPKALLLDEPFSALDVPVRESLRDLVIDLADDSNIPALLVTHDLEEALVFGREIVIISGGLVIEYGSKESIFQCPRYVETARMLDFQIWPIVSSDEKTVRTTSGETFTHNGKEPREAQYIGIRPENIMILRADRPDSSRENLLSGKITALHQRARYIRLVFCSTRGENYLIHAPEHVIRVMGITKGKKIKISLKSESLIFCSRKTGLT
jgi:molybdate transport system ATP-binding protein